MNDKRFHELLNEYLDGELSGEDRVVFQRALQASPRYRMILRQYERLQVAQVAAVARSPRLRFSLFPLGRICRGGALLMNASVLFLSVSLFQAREPLVMDITTPAPVSASSVLNGTAAGDEVRGATPAVQSRASIASLAEPDGYPDVAVAATGSPAQPPEAVDLNGTGLAEEYGFVRL